MEICPGIYTRSGWEIEERSFKAHRFADQGTIFLVGNGHLGYRGTFSDWEADRFVALTVAGTYHTARQGWPELVTAPNPLFTRLLQNGGIVSPLNRPLQKYLYRLDLSCGLLVRSMIFRTEEGDVLELEEERFASIHCLPLLHTRLKVRLKKGGPLTLDTGIDSVVWSLHGKHFAEWNLTERDHGMLTASASTPEGKLSLSVAEGCNIVGTSPLQKRIIREDGKLLRRFSCVLAPGGEIIIEKTAAVMSTFDSPHPYQEACSLVHAAMQKSFEQSLEQQRSSWAEKWKRMDIAIEGDLRAQAALRYCLYHNLIAAPFHTDRLPLGARGLSCQAYQGAAFWDQEVFNLPVFCHTMPEVARNLLVFRHRTLPGAREKAKRLGYRGAFYPWMSGESGEELCPSYFFTDPLTGRSLRNHFNDWQIHISPDISWAIWKYWETSGDNEYLSQHGAEILFEVARFLTSFLYLRTNTGTLHGVRVLGPDEWHENVDDNAFTNYMVRFALEKAALIWKWMEVNAPRKLADLMSSHNFTPDEAVQWKEDAAHVFLPTPHPASGLIEQFRGYFDLEDIDPINLSKRLLHPDEYWGWPAGIAVETQVTKQADVLQLFSMDKTLFDPYIWESNYLYYEPRSSHHSSLSYFAHALVASWIGRTDEAYSYFTRCTTVDLCSSQNPVVGGTFIGGIHTAACGAAWQIAVRGFAGCEINRQGLAFSPSLPERWTSITFPLCWQGCHLLIHVEKSMVRATSAPGNAQQVPLRVTNREKMLHPGETWECRR